MGIEQDYQKYLEFFPGVTWTEMYLCAGPVVYGG